jgi:hypothetical protein
MVFLLASVLFFGLAALGILLMRRAKNRSSLMFEAAARYEQEGRFEDACYHYGIAVLKGAGQQGEVRVRSLWREHGPFDFAGIGEEMRHSYCSRSASCGEGYHQITLREIGRIVGNPHHVVSK